LLKLGRIQRARAAKNTLLHSPHGMGKVAWINDLASLLGVPAGAASLAIAMYAGCSAAEKSARPEALKEIALILNNPSWADNVRPSDVVERMFKWTFGKRHLSISCLARSATASVVFVSILLIIIRAETNKFPQLPDNGFQVSFFILLFVISCIIPDYIALAKSRYLLKLFTSKVIACHHYLLCC
jgi:hypothetical protein